MNDTDGTTADRVPAEEARDLAVRGWLTHDAMWFDQAARSLGIETANRLNRAAIAAMAPYEVQRLSRLLDREPPSTRDADSVAAFVVDGIRLVTPASVSGPLRLWASGPATLRWEWEPGECFAYKGMVRFGWIEGYRCGVIYRIECWLDALGVRPLGDPVVERCLMHSVGACSGELALALGS